MSDLSPGDIIKVKVRGIMTHQMNVKAGYIRGHVHVSEVHDSPTGAHPFAAYKAGDVIARAKVLRVVTRAVTASMPSLSGDDTDGNHHRRVHHRQVQDLYVFVRTQSNCLTFFSFNIF